MLASYLLLLPLAVAHRPLARRPQNAHPHIQARTPAQDLDERLLPITATTTVIVPMTRTETVWVMPTDQVVMGVSSSSSVRASASASSSVGGSSMDASSSAVSSMAPSASISVEGALAVPSSSAHASQSASASSAAASASTSSSAETSSVRHSASASSSAEVASSTEPSARPSASSSSIEEVASSSSTRASSAAASSARTSASEAASSSTLGAEVASSSTRMASSAAASSARTSEVASSSTLDAETATSTREASSVASSSRTSASASSSDVQAEAASSARSSSHVASSSARASESASSSSEASSARPTSSVASSSARPSPSASSSSASSLQAEVASSSAPTSARTSSAAASSSARTSSEVTATSTSSAAPSPTAGSNLETLGSTLMMGYYPDWSGWYLSPEQVDYSKFDVLDFAFALPTAQGGLVFTQDDSSDLLKRLVKGAHANEKRVKLSIGGWTGSAYFSNLVASDSLRATFVANILAAYHSYNLDGIDIDWEYPGAGGAGGNAVSPSDSANYLKFLTDLRAALPDGALISLATQVWPFAGPNGQPLSDVSGFANVIDWILIMNYDIWGSSSTPGPNAPLSNACGNSSQPLANAYASVASWTAAGMPANKITLGLPAYGYLQQSWATSLVQRRRRSLPHKRGPLELGKRGAVTLYNGGGGTTDGQLMFEDLIGQGALTLDGSGNYVGAGGFVREWDACSSTPFLKSTSSGQIVTYDDPQSISLKAQFSAQAGLRGCNVFSIDGDYTNGIWPLTDAARSGLGL